MKLYIPKSLNEERRNNVEITLKAKDVYTRIKTLLNHVLLALKYKILSDKQRYDAQIRIQAYRIGFIGIKTIYLQKYHKDIPPANFTFDISRSAEARTVM